MSLTPFKDEAETLKVLAFKRSGKYYTDYDVLVHTRTVEGRDTIYMQDVFDQVAQKVTSGELPRDFCYLVNHPQGYPGLVNLHEVPYMGGRYA